MFKVIFYAPLMGVVPSYDFVFPTRWKTDQRDQVVLALRPNRNPADDLPYDAQHTVMDGKIEVFQRFKSCDAELSIVGSTFGYFDRRALHSMMILLTIRSRNPVYAPVFTSRSILSGKVNEYVGDIVQPLVPSAIGAVFPPKFLKRSDKGWIQQHLGRCARFMTSEQFQNAMQALNGFSSIPYFNFNFLAACAGLESLFKISGYGKKKKLARAVEVWLPGEIESAEIENLYEKRNRVVHGELRTSGVALEDSIRMFSVLCICLEKVLERNSFPTPS